MSYKRSVFPEGGYDTFIELYDLPPSYEPLVLEFAQLRANQNKIPEEEARFNELTTMLQNYILDTEKWNKFCDAVTGLQKFFLENTQEYIDGLKTETRQTVDNGKVEINTTKDNALVAIENKKDNIIAYMDETTAGAIRNDIGVMGDSTIEGRSLVDKTNLLKTQVDTNVQNITNNSNKINNLSTDVDAHKAEKATQIKLGHVKAGNNITIDTDGTINAQAGGNVDSVNGKTGVVVIDVPDIAGLMGPKLALGNNASAAGAYTVALGKDASAGNYAVALGNNASAGNSAVALGQGASTENPNEGVLGATKTATTSKWIVPGTFTVQGTKNFEIPHPKPEKKATHVIRHGAVESPTPGDTLYRYKITATKENDLVTIDLPDYFIYLNKNVQIWVIGQGHFGNGYGILNRETEQLEIHCQYEGEYNVLVIGTRNDDHPSVQEWSIKGVEREIGESWTGETYVFSVDEIMEIEEIKEEVM